MKELFRKLLPLLLMVAVAAAFTVPKKIQEHAAHRFGEPLFSHALPDQTRLIQADAGKDDRGDTMAALLLETDLTSEALVEFYSDLQYPPAETGEQVSLRAQPLDADSISALKQANLYTEGANYQFVFLCSRQNN